MKKITFENKESLLGLSSRFIVSAEDANEIKTVVNNLVDSYISLQPTMDNMFKYLKINVPTLSTYYDLIIETSPSENFSECSSIILSDHPENFMIFESNKFKNIPTSSVITPKYEGKIIAADISSIVSDENTYCRYYFKNYIDTEEAPIYHTFVLGVNDLIKTYTEEEPPVPVILINDEHVEQLKTCSKNEVTNFYNKIAEVSAIVSQSAYLKYYSIPLDVQKYCEEHGILIVSGSNNSLIDVTCIAGFELIEEETENNVDKKVTNIKCTTTIDGTNIKFERAILVKNSERKKAFNSLKNPFISGNVSGYVLDIRRHEKNGEQNIPINPEETVVNKKFVDDILLSGINVDTTNVKESLYSAIKVKENDMPIKVDVNDLTNIKLELGKTEFTTSENDISFGVSGIYEDGNIEDITSGVEIFADKDIIFDKVSGLFSLEDNISEGDHLITVKYKKFTDFGKINFTKKDVIAFDFNIALATDAYHPKKSIDIKPISSAFSSSDNIICIGKLTYDDGEERNINLTPENASIEVNSELVECVTENGKFVLRTKQLVGKMYETPVVATAKYDNFTSDCFIKILKDNVSLKKLLIEATPMTSQIMDLTSYYSISVSGVYPSGVIRSLTNDANLSTELVYSDYNGDDLNGMTLHTSDCRYSRELLIKASYNDLGDIVRNDERFFVSGYDLETTYINCLTDLIAPVEITGNVAQFETRALYTNDLDKVVSAKYLLSSANPDIEDINDILKYTVSSNKKLLTVIPESTMADKNLIVSSHYAEPYGEGLSAEMSDAMLTGTIINGYDIGLTGSLVLLSGMMRKISCYAVGYDGYNPNSADPGVEMFRIGLTNWDSLSGTRPTSPRTISYATLDYQGTRYILHTQEIDNSDPDNQQDPVIHYPCAISNEVSNNVLPWETDKVSSWWIEPNSDATQNFENYTKLSQMYIISGTDYSDDEEILSSVELKTNKELTKDLQNSENEFSQSNMHIPENIHDLICVPLGTMYSKNNSYPKDTLSIPYSTNSTTQKTMISLFSEYLSGDPNFYNYASITTNNVEPVKKKMRESFEFEGGKAYSVSFTPINKLKYGTNKWHAYDVNMPLDKFQIKYIDNLTAGENAQILDVYLLINAYETGDENAPLTKSIHKLIYDRENNRWTPENEIKFRVGTLEKIIAAFAFP